MRARAGAATGETPRFQVQLHQASSKIPGQHENNSDLTRDLRKALLDFASETPDRLNCMERIEVGLLDDDAALMIESRAVLLSEIAHAIEEEPMPEALKKAFPLLNEEDRAAFTRMTRLLYVLLARSS